MGGPTAWGLGEAQTTPPREKQNRAWENIKENIKTSAKESVGLHELKQHNPCIDEECLHFFG